MEDDDTDFAPSGLSNTSSNLANLFGFTKKPLHGNASLTYAAPKAPKKECSPSIKQSDEKLKGMIIFSKAVQAYKLENRCYVSQGLIGIVISGSHYSRFYEIILYKRTKEHLCQLWISSSFIITVSPNKYVSFYDNNKQNWSIMFQSTEDVEQFSYKIAICKFYSQLEGASDILIQDLAPVSQVKINANSTVEVTYNVFSLIPEELSKVKGEIKEEIKLSNYNFTHLINGLIGASEKCKRIIIFPRSLSGPWLNELGPNKDLLIEITVEKVISESEDFLVDAIHPVESPYDSSSEEASVKARGASLKEALTTTKSQKANLISRMARMGQATLPVKQQFSPGKSDSEEEIISSHPKPKMTRTRSTSNTSLGNFCPSTQDHTQHVSVYQNDAPRKQAQLSKFGDPFSYQQLLPIPVSAITSPATEQNLSVYFSESRIQAAELRMGISKISEKLDMLWNKFQHGVEPEHKTHQQSLMDPGGILISVQNLILENENLKEKVEEQKSKIEQQNDRIFNLLELNHKYLEQNSSTHDRQHENESKLITEMEYLLKKEQEMETANIFALNRMKDLEENLSKSEQLNKEQKLIIENLNAEIETLKKNLAENSEEKAKVAEKLKETVLKASDTVVKLKEKLKEVVSENENLKSAIKTQKTVIESGSQEVKDLKTKNEEYEKAVEDLKRRISDEKSKGEEKIDMLSRTIIRLEEENKNLKEQKQIKPGELEITLSDIHSVLMQQFSDSELYSGSVILTAIGSVFSPESNGLFKFEEKPVTESTGPGVTPASTDTHQNSEPEVKEQNEANNLETVEEKKEENDNQKINEIDSRYKSYDQGWRTAKPPPPTLFDDDDDDDEGWIN